MKTEKAYLIGTHAYSFRSGEPAEIIGIKLVESAPGLKLLKWRLCYEIEFSDGQRDYQPIKDESNYKIVKLSDLLDEDVSESLKDMPSETKMYE